MDPSCASPRTLAKVRSRTDRPRKRSWGIMGERQRCGSFALDEAVRKSQCIVAIYPYNGDYSIFTGFWYGSRGGIYRRVLALTCEYGGQSHVRSGCVST